MAKDIDRAHTGHNCRAFSTKPMVGGVRVIQQNLLLCHSRWEIPQQVTLAGKGGSERPHSRILHKLILNAEPLTLAGKAKVLEVG